MVDFLTAKRHLTLFDGIVQYYFLVLSQTKRLENANIYVCITFSFFINLFVAAMLAIALLFKKK